MKPAHELSLPVKMKQMEKLGRKLSKLKFHLKLKKKKYSQEEYNQINQRIKSCEKYFSDERSRIVQIQASRILGSNITAKIDKQRQEIDKLENLKKYLRKYQTSQLSKRQQFKGNYKFVMKTEQCSQSKQKIVKEYELSPIKFKRKQSQTINTQIELKSLREQKLKNQRYISDFQKKIKEKLQKIGHLNYDNIKDIDQIIQVEEGKSITSRSKNIKNTNSVRLHPISVDDHSQSKNYAFKTINQNILQQKEHSKAVRDQHAIRYSHLKDKIERCRTELKDKHCEQIKRVSNEKLDNLQKNQRLTNLYRRYDSKSKYGDDQALQLMSLATLARANIVLKQN